MVGGVIQTQDRPVPDHVEPTYVVDWDYLKDPRLQIDPHGLYAKWTAEAPHEVVWTTANGGHWMILSNEAIVEALQTPELFSSKHTGIPPRPGAAKLIPEELDPPEHTKYRSQLNKRLGPKMIKYFDGRARAMANELIDRVQAAGKCDLMQALTIPLPCSLFLDMVGLPSERTEEFVQWKDELFQGSNNEIRIGAQQRINAYLEEAIALKRKDGGADDLLGYLVNEGRIDDEPITQADLMAYAFLFFIAGLDTVTATMTNCFHYIATHPGAQDKLLENRSFLIDFPEEILRRYSVVNSVRTATRDFEWRGVQIKAEDQFVAGTAFANVDGKEFPDPLTVDFERENNRHIGFGAGPHRCAGSHLARTELVAVMQEVLPRLPNLRLQPGTDLKYYAGGLIGLTELPVEWDV
ncbi:cytochrome P450 [Novosphingobium hassiacum]|uniref:Cytochrome P450 n=1 Tax=Novosphingobium hassiacum TaxID=173676 RepID=A0A7W5ZX49_9SPHN|nr:cytochrome P450 [Novosphingobium hassiacum]MBB3860952.1 cytochrome P450 [Novosphingobium hassiacum]